jgi:preprotein translocase subunit SecD
MRRLPLILVVSAWAVISTACGDDVGDVRAADDVASSTTTDAPAPTTTVPGTPGHVAFAIAPVLGMQPPPCSQTATRSRDASRCYELASRTLGADVIAKAEPVFDNVEWTVHLELTDAGIEAFNGFAAGCYNKRPECPTGMLAIVLDGAVVSAPMIQTPEFEKDRIQISGAFTEQDARAIADALLP